MDPSSQQLFKKIRHIQYQSTRLANDLLAGAYRSAFKGKGMEFDEVREYQTGDEMRTIDWNVTARMNHLYVKNFQEEREMTVTLLIDISASTRYGSGHHLKSDFIAEIAAVLAFSAIKNNDKIALLLFSNTVEKYIPPNKGTRHVLKIIRELLTYVPKGQGTDISAALAYLGRVQLHSSICFLISDFISPDYSHAAALVASRHDLVSFAIVDPTEKDFPAMKFVSFTDLETDESTLVDTSSKEQQQHLQEQHRQRMNSQSLNMKKLGLDHFVIHTDQPYLLQLRKFFYMRQKRHK